MVATAAVGNIHTHQMDVTTAFPYASLDEEVYMELLDRRGRRGMGPQAKWLGCGKPSMA